MPVDFIGRYRMEGLKLLQRDHGAKAFAARLRPMHKAAARRFERVDWDVLVVVA